MRTKKIVVKPEVVTKQIMNWRLILLFTGISFVSVLIIAKLINLWSVRLALNYVQMSKKVYIDPLTLKKKIDKNDKNYILVDIRSKEEYERGHIKTAVSIPAYEKADDIEKSRTKDNVFIDQYKKLNSVNREIIIYGYLPSAEIIKDISILFMRNGYLVKILAVGWEQWRSGYNQWNPAAELRGMDIGQYIEPVTFAPPTLMIPGQL